MNTALEKLRPELLQFHRKLDLSDISESRKIVLKQLAGYIQKHQSESVPVALNFICTHNSRRSQMAQIWAQTAAFIYDINAICFSGGVEVTAFNERAVEAMRRQGFDISGSAKGNPHYQVRFADSQPELVAFSKLYDSESNPQRNFAAVMTCSDVDDQCPYIPNAEVRIPLYFDDPKAFDDTPLEAAKYDERAAQVAKELLYTFSLINPTNDANI